MRKHQDLAVSWFHLFGGIKVSVIHTIYGFGRKMGSSALYSTRVKLTKYAN